MSHAIKNSFLIGILAIGLAACTSNASSVTNSNLPIKRTTSLEDKEKLLAEKIRLADFSIRAIDDPKFINALLSEDIRLEEEKQCVFNNIDRKAFYKLSSDITEDLITKNSEYIDLYLDKLDLLISIADTFYNSPNAIEFDEEDLSASPALALLPKKDALIFQKMIVDERYRDLLISVGQPVKEDNFIFDYASVKFLFLGGAVGDSEEKCKLKR